MLNTSSKLLASSLAFALFLPAACSTDSKPVKAGKCNVIVSHTAKLLGKLAPSQSEMIKECKKLSDTQRGCLMEASNNIDLMKCKKVK